MRIMKESEDMRWLFYISLEWEAFYFAVRLAAVDIEFHIHNLRNVGDKET